MLRLPLKHLHRAFPELDGYSDEQCRRFIHASRGSASLRFLRSLAIAFITILATAASLASVIYVHFSLLTNSRTLAPGSPLLTWYGLLLNIAIILVACSTPPILGFFTRDLFLIRRVRKILRTHGTCISCRYTLVGLFVAPDLSVTCPECGTSTTVDPALGELVTDEAGRARFKPDESRHKARRFFTEARIRRLKRASPWIATAIVGGPLILAGSYEIFLRFQADTAISERPSAQMLIDLVDSTQDPRTSPDSPDAWGLLLKAEALMVDADLQEWNSVGSRWNPNDERRYPEYHSVIEPPNTPSPELDERDRQRADHDIACRDLALEMLDIHRRNGLYAALREMADADRFRRDFYSDDMTTLMEAAVTPGGNRRRLSSICAARMRLAREAADKAEFCDALRSGLAIASLQSRQPVLLDWLVGVAQEAMILGRLIDEVRRGLPDDWLPEIAAVVDEHAARMSYHAWVEGERIMTLDSLALTFSDPKAVRLGPLSPAARGGQSSKSWLGTYRQNVNETNYRFDLLAAMSGASVKDRLGVAPYKRRLALLDDTALSRSLRTVDAQSRLRLNGVNAMIAIERYRAERGDYPETLKELVPSYLISVPIDPWPGQPIGFVRVDPSLDVLGRAYLIYSTGIDFEDNGGRENTKSKNPYLVLQHPAQPDAIGYDFIVNAPN
ncbi:MAG: hypothetical protein KF902_06645 [Phycisphaeraceae bacterium]|nr:hypothetical protein [Phycisphaeraceae bacterium]